MTDRCNNQEILSELPGDQEWYNAPGNVWGKPPLTWGEYRQHLKEQRMAILAQQGHFNKIVIPKDMSGKENEALTPPGQ